MSPRRRAPHRDENEIGGATEGGDGGRATSLTFFADRAAFFRRFVLSIALQPPPSVERWRRRQRPPAK